MGSRTQFQCVCGGFPTPRNKSGCQQGVQEFNSVWHYLPYPQVESDSTGKGLSLTRLPFTLETGFKPRWFICASDLPTTNQKFSQPPPWVQMAHRTQENLFIHYIYNLLQRLLKDTNQPDRYIR